MCFSPKPALIWQDITPKTKDKQYPHLTNRLKFLRYDEINTYRNDKRFIWIPCQKCLACRISKSNDWATRCFLEAKKWKNNCFITLSYNDTHIPYFKSLNHRDLQLFMKKLRKHHKGIEADEKGKYPIKYFACGEYGDKTLRPHYHIAIYNWIPKDLKIRKLNKIQQPLYTSKEVEKLWGKGFIIIGALTMESAAYIARYTQKKIYDKHSYIINKLGRAKEYIVSSRRPGIGLHITQNKEEFNKIKKNFGILMKVNGQVKLKNIPQSIRRKWREIDNLEYLEIAEEKRNEHNKKENEKLKKISQPEIERIETQEKIRQDTLLKLRRETF